MSSLTAHSLAPSPTRKPHGGEAASLRQPPARPSEARRSTDAGRKEQPRNGRKKSTGDNGELTEVNTKKLRGAVYDVLLANRIDPENPLFKRCFQKLFSICKMYALEGPDE